MYNKKTLIAAALLLGIASAAQAGGKDDADHNGGFRIGPLGQTFNSGVNPVDHPSLARGAYASAARVPAEAGKKARRVPAETGKSAYGHVHSAAPNEPAYMLYQDRSVGTGD